MPKMVLTSGSGGVRDVVVEASPVRFGRHPKNDVIVADDDLASRFHCVIEPSDRGFVLRDLDSRNGTKLNGQQISEPRQLAKDDVIHVGRLAFRVEQFDGSGSDMELEAVPGMAGNGEAKPSSNKDRLKPKKNGKGKRAAHAPWFFDLRDIIENLPPRRTIDERVILVDANGDETDTLDSTAEGAVCVRLLLLLASKGRATDIHIEPKRDCYMVRVRIDGAMAHIVDLPTGVGSLALGLVKSACQFPQSARDAVLDGHFGARYEDRRADFRASFTPTVHGQKLVVRVLDSRTAPQSIQELSLPEFMRMRMEQLCQKDSGMLRTCGPTGSGKTTTLYNCLRFIDRDQRNVVTIEDPVEYELDNCTQIPVSDRQGFGEILRSALRQDPDVILVGEIRDDETARTAMRAAMTGHLVFSTVHAKDTVAAVFRILDLGIEPFLVANSIEVILAQRLVRLLCEDCKRPVPVTPGQATRMGRYLKNKDKTYAPVGCETCLKTGYLGRRAIFEMLEFTDDLRDVVLNQPSINAMRKVIAQGNFYTLEQSGWLLAAEELTSLEEVERVSGWS